MESVVGRGRWPARIAALAGTAGLLGAGVAIAIMVVPSGGDEVVVPAAPAATAAPAEERPPEPKYTDAQRRARRAAVEVLAAEGFRPDNLADYDPEAELRVLVGRAGDGTRRAFFFVRREFVGYDSDFVSGRLRVVRAGDRAVTLGYGLAAGGAERVRFRWDGAALTPESEIPPPELRAPPG